MEIQQESIIPEVLEQSCYLMQTIKLGESEVLVFFDRGANVHIIDGLLAKREGLQKISNSPNALTVVGGDKIYSDHGMFRFNLGPGDEDEYHEIVCIGMNDVTAGFGLYNLSEINREFREHAILEEKNEILLEKVGGSKVQLLLGIKNTKLDPVLLKILPSGIAVYRSPFKDVFGSRVIYGGPHRSFKNDPTGVMASNAVFLMQSIGNGLPDEQEQVEPDLINFFVPVSCPGKGAAEELLIDLDNGQPRINEDMGMMDYQGFRFQSHLNKEGYLETLLDVKCPELNQPILQPGARNMDMETSLLNISCSELNESIPQFGVGSMNKEKPKENRLDTMESLKMNQRGWGMLLAKFYAMMKSCRLFTVKNAGMKLEPFLIMTTVASSIFNVFKLCSNILYFRLLKTADLEDGVQRRIADQRSKPATEEMSLLLTHTREKVWGEKRIGNKIAMISQIIGFKPRINTGKDQINMQRYITRVSKTGLDMPTILTMEQFLPAGAPLLDFLIHDTRKLEGWKYPKLEELEKYQANRGLNLGMLEEIEVRELVCGIGSKDKISEVRDWIKEMHQKDQELFASQVISLDVEDVKVTYYDTLRMAGKLSIMPENPVIRSHLDKEVIHGWPKDVWKQVPGKIMFGNGITWTCLISLDLRTTEQGDYLLERMTVQEGILEILCELPVSTGLAIRRDVGGVEEFYSLISGTEVKLERGFIDLTSLAILAGFKFQCYALGDIKFGFITYNVLAGILLRDLFPDPDVLCKYLECTQETAVNWFLEFLLLSLEGIEYHQGDEEIAQTREEMVQTLRFRDENGKLCGISPPHIRLWTELLGSWPSLTNRGCRFQLQCRQWLPVQMRALARARIQWSDA